MQIRFSFDTKYGKFSDALNLPDDHAYTEEELNLMKEQRRDNWVAYIDSTQIETISETPTETTSDTPTEVSSETPIEPII